MDIFLWIALGLLYITIGVFVGVLGFEDEDLGIGLCIPFWPVVLVSVIFVWLIMIGPYKLAKLLKEKLEKKEK